MSSLPDLGSLRAELRAAGLFELRERRIWLEVALFGSLVAASLISIGVFGWIAVAPAVLVAAVSATSLAMIGHAGSHRSFSSSPFRNTVLTHALFPFLSGLGATYWRNKHDRLHHGHPNVEGVDPDIRPFPFVSSRGGHLQSGPAGQWFQRNFQRWLFWPMSLLMALGMRRSSILYLIHAEKRDRAWWLDAACLSLHYVVWLVVPSFIWGPGVAFGIYAAVWALVGTALALVFLPAHIGLPITHGQNHDWLHQLETTQNLILPKWISFLFIGLDYQVEHHLFPKLCHVNLPAAAKITEAWCQRHGLPYRRTPYLKALKGAAAFMNTAWLTEAIDPQEVRAPEVARAA